MYKSFQIRFIVRFNSSLNNASINIPNEIKIPRKIFRDDLTVLKALSSCVQNEIGPPEYPAIDDAYTFARDYLLRRKFYLSKASGKMSARMAFKEMKHDFIRVANDEPPVKSIMPLMDPSDIEKEVTQERITIDQGLDKIVRLLTPTSAWAFYEANKEAKFSPDVLQNFLELLCATGGKEPSFDVSVEELYFNAPLKREWRADNEAERLFVEIEPKTAATYIAMIRGAAKHNDPTRAIEHWRQMETHCPEASLDLATVNALLRSLYHSSESDACVQNLIVELLTILSQNKLAPTAHTFNNAILAISSREMLPMVESLYGEMISIGIEPTLGTFAVLLHCSFTLHELIALATDSLSIIEARCARVTYEEATSIDDQLLFSTMMVLFRRTKREDLALRLNDVVDGAAGGRFHLFVNEEDRGRYFDCFSKLMVMSERIPLARVIAIIGKFVPRCYMLQSSTLENLIERVARAADVRLATKVANFINWNNFRYVNSDSFSSILRLLSAGEYEHDSELRAVVLACLMKVHDITRTRPLSVLTVADNINGVIDIVCRIEMAATADAGGGVSADSFLWTLIESADQQRILRVSTVRPVMSHCVRAHDFDRVLHLWRCLVNVVSHRSESPETGLRPERAVLVSLVNEAEATVLPALGKCSLNLTETTDCVNKCKAWLAQHGTE